MSRPEAQSELREQARSDRDLWLQDQDELLGQLKRQDQALAELSRVRGRVHAQRKALTRELVAPDQELAELGQRLVELDARTDAIHAGRARLFSEGKAAQSLLKAGVRPAGPDAVSPTSPVPRARPGRALRFLLATEGATVFEHVVDAEIRGLSSVGDGDAPDFLVVPRPEHADLASVLDEVPDHVWARVATGATRLVFDGSTEGVPHHAAMTMRLHQLMRSRNIPARHVAYITQDRLYERHYRTLCDAEGLQPMLVLTHDYFIHRALFDFHRAGEETFKQRFKEIYRAQRWGRRRFLSLNLTPRAHKVLFLLRLLRDGLWDHGFASFGGFNRLGRANEVTRPRMLKEMYRMEGFGDAVDDVAPLLGQLDDMGPILLGMSADTSAAEIVSKSYAATDLPEYRRSWFSVVTESEMGERLHRITEKTLKPLLNGHPLIIFGNPGSLDIVREYGFQTFEGFFDEAYDQEPDSRRRFEMVYDEIVRLIRMDEAELRALEVSMGEVLRFNARWGLVDLPRIFHERITVDLVERLMPPGVT